MSIGSRIKEARIRRQMTQEELAKKIGVTKGAIANYENEVSTPKTELMYKILQVLQCDANYLYQDMVPQTREFTTSFPEQEHLRKYRKLDSYGKKNVDTILDNEYDRCNSLWLKDGGYEEIAAHARPDASLEAIQRDLERVRQKIKEEDHELI